MGDLVRACERAIALHFTCMCFTVRLTRHERKRLLASDLHSHTYSSVLDCSEGLHAKTLMEAMEMVGRRLNTDEADRLVKAFDTDGNGTIDFPEFAEGFQVNL